MVSEEDKKRGVNNIRSFVSTGFAQKQDNTEEFLDLINKYHKLCSAYGFITFEQFEKIPNPIVIELENKIDKENRKWEYFRKVMMAFAGVKKPEY